MSSYDAGVPCRLDARLRQLLASPELFEQRRIDDALELLELD